jgi:ATP-dependent RNA helicase DbpA
MDPHMTSDFLTLDLRPGLLESLEQHAYVEMTPIQAKSLPPILTGSDVIGQAKTGSGKTAAFGLGLLNPLVAERLEVQALVICPTRELADQVAAELRRLAQRIPNTRVLTLCGGRAFRDQRLALGHGAQIVVGTPGRILDHLSRDTLDLRRLRTLVIDEADRMLDMGFVDDVQDITEACPSTRQTLLFSATFPDEISTLSTHVQTEPVSVSVSTQVEPEQLRQLVYLCERQQRYETLLKILAEHSPDAALIFCETRDDCERVADILTLKGAPALALHGGLEQRERDDVLVQFTHGSIRLLVATNVAARGLDIPALPAVIITELSPDPENHLHRIGRTGRAGEEGLAVSIVAGQVEEERLSRIEAFTGQPIPHGGPLTSETSLAFLAPLYRTLMILSGRKDKLRKGDILGALIKDGKIPSEAIGRIDLSAKSCAIAIHRPQAKAALQFLHTARVKKKRVRAILLGSD